MTATMVNKVMQQRLTRGTPVVVAESFGQAKLRGKPKIVTSKGPVKCNKGGRCAGDWCEGLAVFVADAKSSKKDKAMGWRKDTTKVCLTHLKDEGGDLLLPPPLLQQTSEIPTLPSRAPSRLPDLVEGSPDGNGSAPGEVTWDDLANAAQAENFSLMTVLARRLKSQTEGLKSKVIDCQERLIAHLTR